MTIDHYGIDKETSKTLSDMNFVFTMMFISEMGLKILGLGPITYIKDKMNYLDGGVVILSIIELTVLSGGKKNALSAFRTIRIF